jgi:hypothetical protein
MEYWKKDINPLAIAPLLHRSEIYLSLKPALWITFFWVIDSKKRYACTSSLIIFSSYSIAAWLYLI